jgi:hypothetical protein
MVDRSGYSYELYMDVGWGRRDFYRILMCERTLWKVITWMLKMYVNVTKVRGHCKWLRFVSNKSFCVSSTTSSDFSTTRVSYSLCMP